MENNLKADGFWRDFSICLSGQCWIVLRKSFGCLNTLLSFFKHFSYLTNMYFLHSPTLGEQLDTRDLDL